jgi:hypothetical protein
VVIAYEHEEVNHTCHSVFLPLCPSADHHEQRQLMAPLLLPSNLVSGFAAAPIHKTSGGGVQIHLICQTVYDTACAIDGPTIGYSLDRVLLRSASHCSRLLVGCPELAHPTKNAAKAVQTMNIVTIEAA